MTTTSRKRPATWSMLGDVTKKVTEYEAVTAKFHYHFRREPAPFELDPQQDLNVWYVKHRENSPFNVADWEGFRDPHKLTYRSYVAHQTQRESYLENLVDDFETTDHDGGLDAAWVGVLERFWIPSRYAFHTLQMTALYVGQMAPSSFITNASHFQAADEVRRIQWGAYRAKSLSLTHGDSLADSAATRARWEDDEAWQPLREAVEKMLIAYDWGEAYAALNLVIKPALDELFNVQLAAAALAHDDGLTARMATEFQRDAQRSRDWVAALATYAISNDAGHRALLQGWVDKWLPLAERAVVGLAPVLGAGTDVPEAVSAATARFRTICGLA
jgi:toluene monooxygenase system protein E